MAKLNLNREDGKKGSKKPVEFGEMEIKAFEEIKQVLAQNLDYTNQGQPTNKDRPTIYFAH